MEPPSKLYGVAWRTTVSDAPLIVNRMVLQAGWFAVVVTIILVMVGGVWSEQFPATFVTLVVKIDGQLTVVVQV